MSIASGFLLVLVGIWIVTSTIVSDLPARLLSLGKSS